ncbi:MAG: 3-dehydroquinate synthase [Rhizobiales bacterium]|nr:3-dehydroquinate synthase [Hyphomicrobiales bacterium]
MHDEHAMKGRNPTMTTTGTPLAERVVLIGFSGAGKSTTGRLLAQRLGWSFIDTDSEIEAEFGCSVPEIFATHGEATFREGERRQLLAALRSDHVVVATGGGAVVDESLWSPELLRHPATLVIALDAQPETVIGRLRKHEALDGAAVNRPMLAGDDPLGRITELKARRQAVYDRADLTLVVDAIEPEEVAAEIASLPSIEHEGHKPSVTLQVENARSEIYIEPGVADHAGEIMRARWPKAARAWIISDANVGPIHGPRLAERLGRSGFETRRRDVPAGESSKSWATAGELLDWLLDGGIERGDVVIALGGGVIGDLAGFVAATVLRGVPLVQIPTSLLAMVDSSVGGKTGINHASGKNLIGAFYQPPVVLIDPRYLRTLPEREWRSGWAEIVKHAFIQPSTPSGERADLLTFLERNAANLNELAEPATTYMIRRNVALKAAVVEADEREAGIRAYLNFGHTIGHAIEAAGYRYLHGEAVAVGMMAAIRIGEAIGGASSGQTARLEALIDAFGLPTVAKADRDTVLAKMKSDKKRASGVQRWVMPRPSGGVELRTDVPQSAIDQALDGVLLTNAYEAGGQRDGPPHVDAE